MWRRQASNALASLALVGASVCWGGAARAEPLPLQLAWSAPAECPSGAEVERDLTQIARARQGRSLQPLVARATVTRESSGSYHLALELERNGELREAHFDSESCVPLRKAASLVLALAFGDGVELHEATLPAASESSGAEPAAPATPATSPRDQTSAAPVAPGRARHFRLTPWLGAVGSSGFIGSSAVGAEVGLGFGGRYWSTFARASAFPSGTAAIREGVSAELSATTAALGACGSAPLSALRVDGCLGVDVGAVRAHSSGALHDGSTTAPWYALSPLLSALLPLARPFALRAELAVLVPLQAARYDVAPLGTLYASARAIPRATLGLAVEL